MFSTNPTGSLQLRWQHDQEARVYVVTSQSVPGLVVELPDSASPEDMCDEIIGCIEMLAADSRDIALRVHRDRESGTYWAQSPDVDGLVVSGVTTEELRSEVRAARDLLKTLRAG